MIFISHISDFYFINDAVIQGSVSGKTDCIHSAIDLANNNLAG